MHQIIEPFTGRITNYHTKKDNIYITIEKTQLYKLFPQRLLLIKTSKPIKVISTIINCDIVEKNDYNLKPAKTIKNSCYLGNYSVEKVRKPSFYSKFTIVVTEKELIILFDDQIVQVNTKEIKEIRENQHEILGCYFFNAFVVLISTLKIFFFRPRVRNIKRYLKRRKNSNFSSSTSDTSNTTNSNTGNNIYYNNRRKDRDIYLNSIDKRYDKESNTNSSENDSGSNNSTLENIKSAKNYLRRVKSESLYKLKGSKKEKIYKNTNFKSELNLCNSKENYKTNSHKKRTHSNDSTDDGKLMKNESSSFEQIPDSDSSINIYRKNKSRHRKDISYKKKKVKDPQNIKNYRNLNTNKFFKKTEHYLFAEHSQIKESYQFEGKLVLLTKSNLIKIFCPVKKHSVKNYQPFKKAQISTIKIFDNKIFILSTDGRLKILKNDKFYEILYNFKIITNLLVSSDSKNLYIVSDKLLFKANIVNQDILQNFNLSALFDRLNLKGKYKLELLSCGFMHNSNLNLLVFDQTYIIINNSICVCKERLSNVSEEVQKIVDEGKIRKIFDEPLDEKAERIKYHS
ncbi:hypothetical protein EDEG_02966 [Edhazardia aedis USNM 41457]|uniref:Uncharacterized protein n=1 Tax=Edhazardia aedis (strain USNM 41457) TaxID=1003232 RepID=J9D4D2_EDHAE|nr:hypothetical protein EDEG_02966 [Edhazardia aedis USNM 41457]|eukprot:EJW02646.1 hypothetical protein EDEG_02966 [Edhazardia aedis USNM 41457]